MSIAKVSQIDHVRGYPWRREELSEILLGSRDLAGQEDGLDGLGGVAVEYVRFRFSVPLPACRLQDFGDLDIELAVELAFEKELAAIQACGVENEQNVWVNFHYFYLFLKCACATAKHGLGRRLRVRVREDWAVRRLSAERCRRSFFQGL